MYLVVVSKQACCKEFGVDKQFYQTEIDIFQLEKVSRKVKVDRNRNLKGEGPRMANRVQMKPCSSIIHKPRWFYFIYLLNNLSKKYLLQPFLHASVKLYCIFTVVFRICSTYFEAVSHLPFKIVLIWYKV